MAKTVLHELLENVHVGLRKDLLFRRQSFGPRPRYVVHDPIGFQNHAFTVHEYRIMTGIVRDLSLEECFERLIEAGGLEETERDVFYEFVVRLHYMHLLRLPIARADALFASYRAKQAARRKSLVSLMLYARFPLLNPDRFLDRTKHLVTWVFSKLGATLWLGFLVLVFMSAGDKLGDFFPEVSRLFRVSNLPVIWFAIVGLKVIHEFGHAYACKRFGGEVPEMGVAFIIMTPCAYIDASASWKFESRWHRVVVGIAGMAIEMFVAGIATLVWAGTGPGLVHDIALNIILLASITTIVANINPLLRYDGYYVVSDLLGVVNLSKRSLEYLKARAKRLVLGLEVPESNHTTRERWVYRLYGPASFTYKVLLAFTITHLVLMRWSGAGLAVGAVFAWLLIVYPIRRLLAYLLRSPETEPVRVRARITAATGFASAALLVLFFPVSRSVIAPGVLQPGIRLSVRAPANGFVVDEKLRDGATVAPGQVAYVLDNPALSMKRLRLAGDLEAERIRLDVTELSDATRAAQHKTRVGFLEAHVARIDRRLASMSIHTKVGGRVVCKQPGGWLGRYVLEGQELCQVHSDLSLVRIVLTEEELNRARLEVGSTAEIQWTCDPSRRVLAHVREIRRSASRNHVPVELTMLAGGQIYAKPVDRETAEADEPYLHVFLQAESVPLETGATGLTGRVRLQARTETLGAWIRRKVLGFYNAWKLS